MTTQREVLASLAGINLLPVLPQKTILTRGKEMYKIFHVFLIRKMFGNIDAHRETKRLCNITTVRQKSAMQEEWKIRKIIRIKTTYYS